MMSPAPGNISAGGAPAGMVPTPGTLVWRVATNPGYPVGAPDRPPLEPVAGRLAVLTSPSVAAWLIGPLCERLPGLVPPAEVERSRQLNRFRRAVALKWLGLIAGARIEVVAMKGFATAHRFYPDPLIRGMGDVDLLVRVRDISRLVACLESEGFRFHLSEGTPRWGLIGEASFHPFVSADGTFSFDLHVQPDDYPVFRSLDTESVFAAARTIEVDGLAVAVPSDDHLIALAITNAARDKFDPASVRSMVDVIVALVHVGHRCDWEALERLAHAGGWVRRLRVALALLARLGVPAALLPGLADMPWHGLRASAFDAIVADFLDLFEDEPSRACLQWREWVLISSPRTLARRNLRRLAGLIRPWSGLPEGMRI